VLADGRDLQTDTGHPLATSEKLAELAEVWEPGVELGKMLSAGTRWRLWWFSRSLVTGL
jgi:hypothetical protein